MKPLSQVLIWYAELATLFILYSVFCYFMPDLEIYGWYVERYGYVMEEDFLDYYTLVLFTVAILTTTLIIWIVALLRQKRSKRMGKNAVPDSTRQRF